MSSIFSVPELAVGIGISGAASAAFEPKLEVPKQSAWLNNPQRVPDLGLIAALVAGGKVSQESGHNMANRLGFDNGTMDSITWLAQNRLDFALMLRLWRRFGAFDAGDDAALATLVEETLAHEQLDWNYEPWLKRLKHAELVGLGDVAMGIVRSALPAPSYVPVPAPTEGLSVKRFPQVNIDPEKLAAALGFSPEMLQLMVARSGLSLAPGLAATALFRGEINDNDFLLAIAEGDLRTEWAETFKNASREIPTLGQMMEHALRGFEDVPSAKANAKRHGTREEDSQLVYDNLGRAPSVHTVLIGLRRGGIYDGPIDHIPEVYVSAMQRSNLRPEWFNIAYAARQTYPSAFVIRALLQGGAIGKDRGDDLFNKIGWPEDLATEVADFYGKSSTTPADPHVTKAQNQLWTALHSSYVKGRTVDADATAKLPLAGVAAAAIADVLTIWQAEAEIERAGPSKADIRKQYSEGKYDLNTSIARLVDLGWSVKDATDYLGE